jgi:hypothetical protein
MWQLIIGAVQETVQSLDGLWQKFLPMATLFFLMAFVNTVLDNLKDTLIFTMAIGGGAQVVPWLTGMPLSCRLQSQQVVDVTLVCPHEHPYFT